MLIFSTFKEETYRERNAIRSWFQLGAEVVLFGSECISAMRMWPRPQIAPVERYKGIPLLSDMVQKSTEIALERGHERMMYVNADIMLAPTAPLELFPADQPYLLTGLRINVDIDREIFFLDDHERWQIWARSGTLMQPCGADWFQWKPGMYLDMPPFCVGRTTFDNYWIYSAQQKGIETYDVTPLVIALHQNHPESSESYTGELAERNQRLMKARFPEWTPHKGWVNQMPRLNMDNRSDEYLERMVEASKAIQPEFITGGPNV